MNESNETLHADQIEMTENEAESVSALIENPPEPNEKLKAKAAMYGVRLQHTLQGSKERLNKDQKND